MREKCKTMKSVLRTFLFFLLVLTVSHAALAQEFPFIHFPDKTGVVKGVLAFQQNSNKEILFVNPGGVYSFNGRQTTTLISFTDLGISGIRQAQFTSGNLALISSEGLFSIDLKSARALNIRKEGVERIFYNQGEDHLYILANGVLELITEKGETQKVIKEVSSPEAIHFSSAKYFVIAQESVKMYSAAWALEEKVKVGEPIIDSYFGNEKLWVLTASGILAKDSELPGIKFYQALENESQACILEDRTGKIWVGTENKGVLLLDGSRKQILSRENNFSLTAVKGIHEGSDFSLWFYGEGGMDFKPFSAPFRKFHLGQHLRGREVQDIKELADSRIAVYTKEGFLHLIEDETLKSTTHIQLPFEPHFSRIVNATTTFHVSRRGNILLHSSKGNFRCSIRKDIVNVFTFDDRSLIVCQDGSTYEYNHSTYNLIKSNFVVSVERPLFQSENSLIYTDPEGNVKTWDSERGSNLAIGAYTPEMLHAALLNEKYFVFLSKDKQLKYSFNGRVLKLDFKLDENEKIKKFFISNLNLWISTESRLYQIGFYLKEDALKLLEPKVFNTADYALQLPVFKSVLNEEGSYYLAAENTVSLYHSFALAPDVTEPGIVLEKLYIQRRDSLVNVDFKQQDSIRISLGKDDQLFVKAFPVNYDAKNKALLKYRFLSGDNRWKKPFEEDIIPFSEFEPGQHVVEIISENEQGVKSARKILLYLDVRHESWYNWWTFFGASLSIMLVGYFAFSGLKSLRDTNSREAKEKFEKELLKLQKKTHEQMMKAEGLKQVNQLITAQKEELEDKNKQIVAQKYELSLTNNQIKQQKDVIEKTSEKLQSSINYAQRIQTALMGDEILIKEDLPESFVLFKPRDQVSGDFFWFDKIENELGEEVLIIAAVDCTGHGVPGAIVSVVGIQLLNAIVKAKKISDPGKILTQLNIDLLDSLKFEQTQINDGMDMSMCSINLKQNRIYFAGAKNPLYIIKDGLLEIIKGDKFPIGGQKLRGEKEFTTHELELKKDGSQMFYLFTDGYQDQFGGPNQTKFMAGNFKNLLIEMSAKPMMEQKYILGKTIKEWQGEEEQTDDILVIGFRI